MNEKTLQAIRDHVAKEFGDGSSPKESCGLVIVRKGKEEYVPCRNTASNPGEQFSIHCEDFAAAEEAGEIVMVVHSHPYLAATPSQADLIGCESSGLPWMIMSWPSGVVHEFAPSGYKAPLVGRSFTHGITDCYSLIRDYYSEMLDIQLIDFDRDFEWWHKGQNLYVENFEKAGFVQVPGGLSNLQLHDVVFMQIASPVVNHAGVYVGDNVLLHHFYNRLSSRDVFGQSLRRYTTMVVRNRRFINA